LEYLVQELHHDQLIDALTITQQINDEKTCHFFLNAIEPFWSGYKNSIIVNQLYEIDQKDHADFLEILAINFPVSRLDTVIEAVLSIEEMQRVRVLDILLERLPKSKHGKIVELVSSFQNPEALKRLMSLLAKYLSMPQIVLVHKEIMKLDGWDREILMPILASQTPTKARDITETTFEQSLIKFIYKSNVNESFEWFVNRLHAFADKKRTELLENIVIPFAILLHIGPSNTPREIYDAVRDVTTWWP